ncbi:MAG: DUF4445 domain-containing protein [Anaerolineae bacterium]|nr:DUF4445 domain-containing protein [Anaerolineae bacterium]
MDASIPLTFRIDLEPAGKRVDVPAGADLLTAAQQAGIELVAACSGMGICGTCKVRLVSGELSPPTPSELDELGSERLAAGWRLACQAVPRSNVRIEVPPETLAFGQKLQVDGLSGELHLQPAVEALELALDPPNNHDLRADWTRARQALALDPPPLTGVAVLNQLSHQMRAAEGQVRLALHRPANRLVAVLPPHTPLLGLAVDLGSTKLAFFLMDLAGGAVRASLGVMNPQIAFGEDVVSRIAYANNSVDHRRRLQSRLVETFNHAIAELCAKAGAAPQHIVDAVVVGNTAMHHLFCGLPVSQLGNAPYVPAVSDPLDIPAADLGLALSPGALVHLPANIAGYVGADHTAALLATQPANGEVQMLVDIGTNTEISLTKGGKTFACSTASGPAFEGAHISQGMRAAPGAIERVQIVAGEPLVATIGGGAAVGICGTGILSTLSELLRHGIIDRRGAFQKGMPGLRPARRGFEYLLVPAEKSGHGREIVVTRGDINEIMLAKGAIRAGIEVLLAHTGVQPQQVTRWVIAGAFGTYLDLTSAVAIGMFPHQPLERFHQVGNAAGVGARQMLLSSRRRAEAAALAAAVEYIELTVYPGFTDLYVRSMYLGEGK